MHGHGHLELAKNLNDKIPKTIDEMFERVRAFIIREVAAGSAEMTRPSQWDKGNVHLAWFGGPKKARSRGCPREARRNMGIYTPGHDTNDCYQLKKQIEEAVASGKLAHLVKDIHRNNQRNGSQGRNNVNVINMIRGGGSLKRPFEGERSGLTNELTFLVILRHQLTDEPIILEGMIEGHQTKKMQNSAGRLLRRNVPPFGNNKLRVTMGKAGRNKMMLMEFTIIKCRSSYNVIIGRTGMRSLRAVGSTIYSMIKFLTNQGIVTMEKSGEALWEYRQLERVQVPWEERMMKRKSGFIRKKGYTVSPHARRIKKLGDDTSKDDGKGGQRISSEEILRTRRASAENTRLYLGKETIKEGSGVGIILVSPDEKMHSYAIRLKFNASDHAIDCEALLAGLVAYVNKGMKDLHVFIDSLTLVTQIEGNHTPAMEQERKYKVGNHKVGISQSRSIGRYQNKTIGGGDKRQ
ncbi:reverse transcriptase domain-containing protein [Tanacetum coccineum]